MQQSPRLTVDPADVAILRRWCDELPPDAPLALRARVVLLSEEGLGTSAAARALRCSKQTVTVWRERYRTDGLDGLTDAPRPGRPVSVDPVAVLLGTMAAPGPGQIRWSSRTLAVEMGISNVAVASRWRQWGIRPEPGGRIALLTEPVLDAPVLAVEGLLVRTRLHVLVVAGPTAGSAPDRRLPAPDGTAAPDVGDAVADLLSRAGTRNEETVTPDEFLARLDEAHPEPGPPLRMIVEGGVPGWLDDRFTGTVHVVPAGRSWLHLVRAACFAASVHGDAASVEALLVAVSGRDTFSWVRPRTAGPLSAAPSG